MDSTLVPIDIDSALDELERLEESNENNNSKQSEEIKISI